MSLATIVLIVLFLLLIERIWSRDKSDGTGLGGGLGLALLALPVLLLTGRL